MAIKQITMAATLPELRASGCFLSWSAAVGGLVVTGFEVVAAVGVCVFDFAAVVFVGGVNTEVVGTVLVVKMIVEELVVFVAVVIAGFVLPRVVFSEVWFSEEGVVSILVAKPEVTVGDALVDALVALLVALLSSVAGEVAL